jgi:hypothetical protein
MSQQNGVFMRIGQFENIESWHLSRDLNYPDKGNGKRQGLVVHVQDNTGEVL